jgi:putative membrane protein
MRRIVFVSVALASAMSIVGCNGRDAASHSTDAVGTTGDNGRTKVGTGDKDFVHDLAIAGMAEVELGRLASERGSNAEVKKFGQMMIDDHTKAGTALKGIASRYNIPVPSDLDDKHRDLRDKLSQLQGAEFDRQYMTAMVDGHEDVLEKVGSRVDRDTLSKWKADMADRVSGKKVEARSEAIAIRPEPSDNEVTTAINQWAANAYPVVSAHLEAAKVQNSALKTSTSH